MSRPTALGLALVLAPLLLLASCGDDSDDTTTDPPGSSTTTTTRSEPPPDAGVADDDPADTDGMVDEEPRADVGPIAVGLTEFAVVVDTEITAGTQSFEVTNEGKLPHELGIARGMSYEDLPKLDNGAIDEAALGDAFLGKTDVVEPDGTASIDFDLEAGDYVFFCNIQLGPNSHAANGQTLPVRIG